MKLVLHVFCLLVWSVTAQTQTRPHVMEFPNHGRKTKMDEKEAIKMETDFRSEFLQILLNRRPPQVPLKVEIAKPVVNTLHQNSPPSIEEEIMMSSPKKDIKNFKELLKEENLYLNIEEGDQGKLPVLILSLKESNKKIKRPAVVFLHGTNKYKEYLRPLLEVATTTAFSLYYSIASFMIIVRQILFLFWEFQAFASRGYIAISVDSRCHGERAKNATTYRDALISAWRTGDTMPFIYDTAWDLIKLADYLTQRQDIDPSRIGIAGISLGGMHAWFAAAADTRYSVVAPLIGVQGFRWAVDHDKWHDRVNSIKHVFEVARHDLGKSAIDKEVVLKVWDRIAPGLASYCDSPFSVPSIAPRPLLIINGADDARCHLAGLENVILKARQTYAEFKCSDNFKFIAEPGIKHEITKLQMKELSDWFDKFLKPQLVSKL